MALTESKPLELGLLAPEFTLLDTVSGQQKSLSDLKGLRGTLVCFICNHCPFVVHVNPQLIQLAKDYQDRGIRFVAISSNDAVIYPQDGPEKMKEVAAELGYSFPYLYDESQAVAKAYDAVCTPDFYLLDNNCRLVYHGQLDDARPGNELPLTGKDMRLAMDKLLQGESPLKLQKPSIGCSIKWKE